MTTSTFRFIAILFSLNLLLFLGSAIYNDIAYSQTIWENERDQAQGRLDFFVDDFGEELPDSEDVMASSSFGDERGAQQSIWSILIDGIRPLPTRDNAPTIERIVMVGINFIRVVMGMFTALMIIFIIKNKRQD